MTLFRFMGVVIIFGYLAGVSHSRAPAPKEAVGNEPVAEVQVVGVYEGTYPPGIRHQAGFHPPGAVTVKVKEVKKPVILVLTSYEPVVWRVEAPKGAIARVIASGYYKQAVEGLDEKVPVTLISHEASDKDYFYAYRREAEPNASDYERAETKRKYQRLIQQVKELTKQEIKGFQGKYAGSTFEIK
jgi:hypothetical protein